MNSKKINILFCVGLLMIIFLMFFVFAKPQFNESLAGVTYYGLEDSLYSHNFTADLVAIEPNLSFSFIYITGSEHPTFNVSSFSWIFWNDSILGIMIINSVTDNQTGFFNMSISVINNTGWGDTAPFYFQINATNDAPNFTHIHTEYNLSQNQSFTDYINATDQEGHYPLTFNISFLNSNCTHATWTGRNNNENCSLFQFGFNLTSVSNLSALMNFTPAKNDVGTYWANISVSDYGEGYACPNVYCDNSTYMQNKTTFYSRIIKFNILSALEINVTDCQNKVFQENVSGTCQINITSKGETDNMNISSSASLRNYGGSIQNKSWFFANTSTTTANFTATILINITAHKTEIGNWTINFTVFDTTHSENLTQQINVYVNRSSSLNDAPDLAPIPNTNTSIDLEKIINLTVYDDDLLIPDKNSSAGGYNETTTFTYTILNRSDLSQNLSLSNFSITILYMPFIESGFLTNKTKAEIRFTARVSDSGDYTINITVNDSENSLDFEMFNLSILSNNIPTWNQTSYTFLHIVNSTFGNTTRFGPINLTGDGYSNDSDGNPLSFANSSSAFPSFNLSSNGIIVFTPWKPDIGYWSFSVTATDPLGLENTTTFAFNISNINSDPIIKTPISATNASADANSNINATEGNYTILTLWIQDEDFRVATSQKVYYNESLTFSLTIEGPNSTLFNFTKDQTFPIPGNNLSKYTATFIPNQVDLGIYNITINATDIGGSSDILSFNLTINLINDAPVLMDLTNHTSAINRSFYYDINATDEEDGNDTQGNLTFSYSFLTGTDFIGDNQTIFNTTSGILSVTFNDTQDESYEINISVNDTGGLLDSGVFWIYVYGLPNVTYPPSVWNFSLQENVTSNRTFRANHSMQDNLTYEFYINGILRYNLTYYGNETNLTWEFTPNLTDETHGQFQNLTLSVYTPNPDVENRTSLNTTSNWNLNISHTNSPVAFAGRIADQQTDYAHTITVNLSNYFSDIDYSDSYYNQTINFTARSNSTASYITSSISNWILTLSSLIAVVEIFNVTANDSSTAAASNGFEVRFTTPATTVVTTPTPTSGGGGSTTPVSLKIIIPDPISAYQEDRIVVPITLYNNGQITLSGVTLDSIVVRDNVVRNDIKVSFDKSEFSSLKAGQKENVTLTIDVNTVQMGTFEITLNASVKAPKYYDWGKLYLTIKEGSMDRLLFVEEFVADNPECIELTEIVNEAKEYFRQGDFANSALRVSQAIDACKKSISQYGNAETREKTEGNLYFYFSIATLLSFLLGVSYYFYGRNRLRRNLSKNLKTKKNRFNKTLLVIGLIVLMQLIGLFVLNDKIAGFVTSNLSSTSKNEYSLIFIFIIVALGFFIFLNRKKIDKFVEIRRNNRRKNLKNKIKSLFKKKVYTSSGDYIGEIKDVILGKNKINSLKIKLDGEVKRKNKISANGIIIKYQQVKSVGHILIVGEEVLKLNKRRI